MCVFFLPEDISGPLTIDLHESTCFACRPLCLLVFKILHLLYMTNVRKLTINHKNSLGSTFAALYQGDHHV